jgi:virulence-associated protein VapD
MTRRNKETTIQGGKIMYAIAFDLDTEMLTTTYKNESIGNAYKDIKNVLQEYGFCRQQGSVYFGDSDVSAVTCMDAVAVLTDEYDWFSASVKDIRMLRIEDNNDLMPVINRVVKLKNRQK